jgi:hypothetical protein
MLHSLTVAADHVSVIDQLVPFIAGFATQILGSAVQYGFLHALKEKQRINGDVHNELLRDGDLVQMLCTASVVVPSAIIAFRSGETFLVVTIFVAIVVVALSILVFRAWDVGEYRRYSLMFLTPACVTALAFCLGGGVAAYFGHS